MKILVALSGGADSVALLRMMLNEGKHTLEALHCNFQLRGEESKRDEQFVTELCERLNVPLHVKHFDTLFYAKDNGISTEMAARELRYKWFEEMREHLNADYIAVAHHQEDQAETILLNLVRGTGLRGLAGMKAENRYIIRPLLDKSKREILDYLQSIGQNYVTDSTNLLRDAQRNQIRLDVIPLLKEINPRAISHICEAASRVADAIPYYIKGIESSNELDAATLHEKLRGMGFTPAQERDILKGNRSGAMFESTSHRVVRHGGEIVVEEKGHEDTMPQMEVKVVEVDAPLVWLKSQPLTPDYAYLDAQTVAGGKKEDGSYGLTLRHPQEGDRFQPYGMKHGTRLISDFLTDLKINVLEKRNQWLICSGNNIVWVANLRIDHRYRVTDKTQRILVIRLKN